MKKQKGSVFGLSLLLLLCLLTMAILQLRTSQESLDFETKISLKERKILQVQSQLNEAFNSIALNLNLPGSALFQAIRARDIQKNFVFEVPTPVSYSLYSQDLSPLSKENVVCEIRSTQLYNRLPYEYSSVLECGRQVHINNTRPAIKFNLSIQRELKSALITLPRPFDQPLLYVHDTSGWIEPAQENANITHSFQTIQEALPETREYYHNYFQNQLMPSVSELPQVQSKLSNIEAMLDSPPLPVITKAPELYPEVSASSLLAFSKVKNFDDLGVLDLRLRLRAINQLIVEKTKSLELIKFGETATFDRVMKKINKEIKKQQGLSPIKQMFVKVNEAPIIGILEQELTPWTMLLAKACAELAEAHMNRLNLYLEFQSLVTTGTHSDNPSISSRFQKFHPDVFQKKSWFKYTKINPKKWREYFLPASSNNGIFFYDTSKKLRISKIKSYKGSAIHYMKGPVSIANVKTKADSLLTIIGKGQLDAMSEVQANLVALSKFKARQSMKIHGSLVLGRALQEGEWKGSLGYKNSTYSGKKDSQRFYRHIAMTLSPFDIGKKLEMGEDS